MKKIVLATFISIIIIILSIALYLGYNLYFADESEVKPKKLESIQFEKKDVEMAKNKWDLWSKGTQLRGANIYQRKVYKELDGPEFMGPGPVGPPYKQEDFLKMAEIGANYVNISHPGLFTEKSPFKVDKKMQKNLDRLLKIIEKADMFAVISFRTGPGRSEFTFFYDEVGDWFDESYLDDSVWESKKKQTEWANMWRYTAERYKDNPVVVGYDLMVEPNANEMFFEIYEPDEFYEEYKDSTYDWNKFYPQIVKAIREVDKETPILIGGMGYSSVEWLPHLKKIDVQYIVYTAHQYQPYDYTHQEKPGKFKYPGKYDFNYDGQDEPFNQAWIKTLLQTVDDFKYDNHVPVAINEFGAVRWTPGVARFMYDQFQLFEQRGINNAFWVWDTFWEPHAKNDAFNFRHGPNRRNHKDVESSELIEVIQKYWELNEIRPSDME